MIETTKFTRKPFFVDAVQVTESNLEDVAKWCMGDVVNADLPAETHIRVRVHRPLTERQTKAFVGDWVLYAGTGFKVYTPKAFEKSFEKANESEAGVEVSFEGKDIRKEQEAFALSQQNS